MNQIPIIYNTFLKDCLLSVEGFKNKLNSIHSQVLWMFIYALSMYLDMEMAEKCKELEEVKTKLRSAQRKVEELGELELLSTGIVIIIIG